MNATARVEVQGRVQPVLRAKSVHATWTLTVGKKTNITLIATPSAELELARSGLSQDAKYSLLAALTLARGFEPVGEDFGETEDGGGALDLTHDAREVYFVVPQTGARLYFAARSPNSKRAGVVDSYVGLTHLVFWLVGIAKDLDVGGLTLG